MKYGTSVWKLMKERLPLTTYLVGLGRPGTLLGRIRPHGTLGSAQLNNPQRGEGGEEPTTSRFRGAFARCGLPDRGPYYHSILMSPRVKSLEVQYILYNVAYHSPNPRGGTKDAGSTAAAMRHSG